MEATLQPGDTPEQCLTELKQRLDNWFWETHPELSSQRGSTITDVKEVPAVDARLLEIIQDIENSTVIDQKNGIGVQVGLLAYEKMASGYPELQAAYDKKMDELTNKTK
jgi:hypothetical protein